MAETKTACKSCGFIVFDKDPSEATKKICINCGQVVGREPSPPPLSKVLCGDGNCVGDVILRKEQQDQQEYNTVQSSPDPVAQVTFKAVNGFFVLLLAVALLVIGIGFSSKDHQLEKSATTAPTGAEVQPVKQRPIKQQPATPQQATELPPIEQQESTPQTSQPTNYVNVTIKAAEQGDAKAQFLLGTMYDDGKGVPQDYKQAVVWYRKAAEQGSPSGQILLGTMYDDGKGVPQNYKEAVTWYRKAAEQGDDVAQEQLGNMYHDGKGVLQDDVNAYAWASLAAAQGNVEAVKGRDEIASYLTPDQRNKAQVLAAELQAKIDKQKK